jgi:hypothetical protein
MPISGIYPTSGKEVGFFPYTVLKRMNSLQAYYILFQAFIFNGTEMLPIGQTYIMEQQKQGLDSNQNAQGEQKNNDTANQQQNNNQNSNTNTNRDTDKEDDQKRQEEKQPTQPGTSK